MPFDHVLLGSKLKEARISLRIEADEAASEISVAPAEYVEIEKGARPVTGDQLVSLALLFRRDFRYFVTGQYPSAESQVKKLFRQYSQLTKADRVAIQEFIRLCEHEASLYQHLGRTFEPLRDYSSSFVDMDARPRGRRVAEVHRKILGITDSPIPDIFGLVRSQGVHVFRRKLVDSKVSGLYVRHPTAGHCILVNYIEDPFRQNFSLAHEYCHSLLDSEVEESLTHESEQTKPTERRANSFAGHFLVPSSGLRLRYGKPTSYNGLVELVIDISQTFKVNGIVTVIRLQELGWTDAATKARLELDPAIVIRRKAKADSEIPTDLSPGSRSRIRVLLDKGLSAHFLSLCRDAYELGFVTFGKVAEMLCLPYDEARDILGELNFLVEVMGR